MTDNQISCFLEAAKEKNFTRAAENLFQTQPGISRSISNLEKELNTTLFVRHSNKQLELTESGQLFYDFFNRMKNEFLIIKQKSDQMQRLSSMNLRFGYATGWTISAFFPIMMGTIQEKFSHLNMDVECHSFLEMTQLLKGNQLDIILTVKEHVDAEPDLDYYKICELPQVLLYSEELFKQNPDKLSLRDFENETFITIDGETLVHQKKNVYHLCEEYGFRPRMRLVANQATMISYVENKKGVMIMDLWSQPIFMKQFRYMVLPAEHNIVLACRKENRNSKVMYELAKTLSQIQV